MASIDRRTRERGETRQLILDTARELFVEHGYDATTMRAVAEQIEFTPTAIYHHFKNKEALLAELCQRDFGVLAKLFQKIGQIEDPIERIERIGAAYVDFALENPMQYRFMFITERPRLPEESITQRRGEPSEDAYAFLRQTCVEAIRGERFRPEVKDADELAQILWGAMHGIVSIRLAKEHDGFVEFRDTRTTAARMRDVLMRGLLR